MEQRHITEFPGWTIYIGRRKSDTEFENVLLYESRQEQLTQRIHARRASVTTDPATRQIIFRLFDAEVFKKSLSQGEDPSPGAAANSPVFSFRGNPFMHGALRHHASMKTG